MDWKPIRVVAALVTVLFVAHLDIGATSLIDMTLTDWVKGLSSVGCLFIEALLRD